MLIISQLLLSVLNFIVCYFNFNASEFGLAVFNAAVGGFCLATAAAIMAIKYENYRK